MKDPTISPLATRIVDKIFHDASDRSCVFGNIDRETLDEIRNEWETIAQAQLQLSPKRWRYASTNLFGNAHDAVRQINEKHPEWDVICMSFDGENGTPGSVTLVVYREEIRDE
jgi:hypothetical protein